MVDSDWLPVRNQSFLFSKAVNRVTYVFPGKLPINNRRDKKGNSEMVISKVMHVVIH